ncbi:MAG: type III polyketide synthase [Hyphomicrobiales bacterium]|nr:MAG: type III polyketide synthase [Hyphomicrobiales bacterium]
MQVYLNGLATAVPPHLLPQPTVEEVARKVLGTRYSQFERLAKTFQTSGVEHRYSMVPLEWFYEPKNWPERNAAYLEGSKALFIEVARAALKDASWSASDVDTIVTVSSTGIATPTLEALAWKEMGFRTDVNRIPVFGLGCAGGVSGMSIAQAMAYARPGSKVLIVALEACSVSFRSDRMQKADIIATVLFGDGAAAVCMSTELPQSGKPIVSFGQGQEELWSDTLSIMGWDVDETGLGVIFDRSIPQFAEENLAEAADKALARSGLKRSDIARFVCHPGGAKVVDAIETAMEIEPNSLDAERTVLRDYGNMSAPTVMFVLKRVLESGQSGQMMMSALGPGFTSSFMPIHVGSQNA